MVGHFRSTGITHGKISAEIIGLAIQLTWKICELKGKILTASRRKGLLLQEVHEGGR